MKTLLPGLLTAFLLASPALAGPPVSLVDRNNNPIGTTANPLGVADPNNAAYASAGTAFATGATVAPGRAIYLNCSASGSVTMVLSGGGSIAYPMAAAPIVLPLAVTSVTADTASCTHQNLN